MKPASDKTEYILLPLSIYQKFFKDVKISGKQITAVIDEASIKGSRKRLSKNEPSRTKTKKSRQDASENESQKMEYSTDESDISTDSSD